MYVQQLKTFIAPDSSLPTVYSEKCNCLTARMDPDRTNPTKSVSSRFNTKDRTFSIEETLKNASHATKV